MNAKEMVKEFQCPGCVCGIEPDDCNKFDLSSEYGFHCKGHVIGTTLLGVGHIALGLPKGFNRPGMMDSWTEGRENASWIRLWPKEEYERAGKNDWDRFNIAVWAMEMDGCLFVRTYCPRVNLSYVDVVDGGTLAMVPDAVDVSKFYEDMD